MAKQIEKQPMDAASASARAAPTMKSHALSWQSQGHTWREALVKARAVQLWADYQPMDGFFVYAFAFAKIALTCVLSYIVVGHATRIKEKPQPGQAVGTMTSSGSVPGV